MPRMTGLELLRELRDRGLRVVRILSTAYTDSGLVQEAVEEGLIDYFIVKPWDFDKMREVLAQAEKYYRYRLARAQDKGRVA